MPDMGIGEFLAAIGSTLASVGTTAGSAAASGLGALGVGSETAGLIGSGISAAVPGAIEGGALGAGTSAIAGGDPLQGALQGAATMGLAGAGSVLGPAAGIGATAGEALGGAVGGAGLNAATGQNPLIGGIEGLGAGLAQGALNGTPSPVTGTPVGVTGGGASPASTALPSSAGAVGGGTAIPDFTAGFSGLGLPSTPVGTIASGTPTAPSITGGSPPAGTGDGNWGVGSWVAKQLGLGTDAGNFLDKNGGQFIQGGLMGLEQMQQQNQFDSLLRPLRASATTMNNESRALSGAMFGGQLPAGAKAAVDNATQSAKARVRSQYANLGLAGSTMEADALNQVDREAAAQTFQMADQLLQQGQSMTQMSDQLYQGILGATMTENQDASQAIANFAAELMGAQVPSAGRTVTLNLGG